MTEVNQGQQQSGNAVQPAAPAPSEEIIKVNIGGEMRDLPKSKVIEYASKGADAEEKYREMKLSREEIAALGGMERVRELAELGTLLDENPDLAEKLAAAIQEKYATDEKGGVQTDPRAIEATVLKTVREEMQVQRGQQEMEEAFQDLHKEHGDFDEDKVVEWGAQHGIWNVKVAYEKMNEVRLLEARDKKTREETAKAIKEGRELGESGGSAPAPEGPVSTEGMSVDQLTDVILQDARRGTLVPKK